MAVSLAEIIAWKYGSVASTKQKIRGDKSIDPEMVIFDWRHSTISQPDDIQIQADRIEYQAYLNSIAYKELRRREYPSTEKQLDALWKGGQDMADMKASINAIKAKYPKP